MFYKKECLMNFDHAFVIGMPERSPKLLDRFYKSCGMAGVKAELWKAVYGLDVDIDDMINKGYLSQDF